MMASNTSGSKSASKPAFNVFTVEERENEDPFWLKIGICFEHKDGKGLNLILNALPLDNRLVLRIPSDEKARESEAKSKNSSNGRSRRSR